MPGGGSVFAVRLVSLLISAVLLIAPSPPWTGLPMRTQTQSHIPGDPVNVAFEGSRAAILAAFGRIGWVQADPISLKNDVHLAEAAIRHTPYPRAPVSN